MTKYYDICGNVIRCLIPDDMEIVEDRILAPYVTESTDYKRTLEFEMVEDLKAPEGELMYLDYGMRIYQQDDTQTKYIGAVEKLAENAYQCVKRQGNYSLIQLKRSSIYNGITNKTILNSMEAEHMIAQNRGILLHSSYICWEGNAVLFTAPSGTGKSTQAELWCQYENAELINGDRAAIMLEEQAMVHGIPFSGSSGVCKNTISPLKAIIYLQQAPQNSLVRLKGRHAFSRVWEGCSINVWNREDMEKCSQTVIDIISKVPVYLLQCTADKRAIDILKEELMRQV